MGEREQGGRYPLGRVPIDLGEIARHYIYRRTIRPTKNVDFSDSYLLSDEDLISKLSVIYDRIGIELIEEDTVPVNVLLPNSSTKMYRNNWQPTTLRKSDIPYLDVKGEFGLSERSIWATWKWLTYFDSKRGDPVFITPFIPSIQI